VKTKMMNWVNWKILDLQERISRKHDGMGTVEVILIIVCLVGIVIIFKNQLTDLVESIFSKITSQANRV
jgi:hypothetical protein